MSANAQDSSLLAISGASGALGGRVAQRLAGAGQGQRLIVRDAARAPTLPEAEVAEASYGDPASMRRALTGVRTFFMVSAHEAADRVQQHIAAVDAAVAAGVGRIVYTSSLGAARDATFTFARDHWQTEVHIRGIGLDYTFLRNSLYIDIVPWIVGADGVIRGPAGEGCVTPVARDDIADAAVAVLLGGGRDGATYDLTGPERLTMRQIARTLSRVTGRDIPYYAETMEEAYESRTGYGASGWEVDGWVTSYAAIAAGEMEVVSDAVFELTGHSPVSLDAFLGRYPESYRHLLPA